MRTDNSIGKVQRVQANYQLNIVPFHPDLFYYGIHGVEALYAVMGTGCTTADAQGGARQRRDDVHVEGWPRRRLQRPAQGGSEQPVLELTGSKGTASTGGPEPTTTA